MTIQELAKRTAGPEKVQTQLIKTSKNSRGPFVSLGEQLAAIRHSAISRRSAHDRLDPRLAEIQRRAAAGASESVPADGGFLLQSDLASRIVRRMYRVGQIFGRCTEMPITAPNSNGLRFPQFDESSRANGSRLGGVQVYWANETDSITASKPKFMSSELTAEKIIGLLYCTDELARDSDALDAWAKYAFSQELLFRLENCIVSGTGQGQPAGVLGSGALLAIAAETGQAAGTVVSSNVEKMRAGLWAASRENAVWIYNQELLPQLAALQTVVGAAGSESKLWQWASAPGEPDMLAGIPAYPSEYCAAPGGVGDIILADYSRYMIAMREERCERRYPDSRVVFGGRVGVQVRHARERPVHRPGPSHAIERIDTNVAVRGAGSALVRKAAAQPRALLGRDTCPGRWLLLVHSPSPKRVSRLITYW